MAIVHFHNPIIRHNAFVVTAVCGSACFGEGEGVVHYKDVDCPIDAQSFANCTHSGVGSGECSSHTRDAGLICGKNWPYSQSA